RATLAAACFRSDWDLLDLGLHARGAQLGERIAFGLLLRSRDRLLRQRWRDLHRFALLALLAVQTALERGQTLLEGARDAAMPRAPRLSFRSRDRRRPVEPPAISITLRRTCRSRAGSDRISFVIRQP